VLIPSASAWTTICRAISKPGTEASSPGSQTGTRKSPSSLPAGEPGKQNPPRSLGEDLENKTLPLIYTDNTDQDGKTKARTYRGFARMIADLNFHRAKKPKKREGGFSAFVAEHSATLQTLHAWKEKSLEKSAALQ
jgi:hypothetical protein